MSEVAPHPMPARNTAVVSLLVAAAVGLVLGAGAGMPLTSALAVGGGLAVGAGAWGLNESVPLRTAGGSVAAVAGAVALLASPLIGVLSVVPAAVGLAVTLIAVDGAVGTDTDWEQTLWTWMRSNVVLFLLASIATAVVWIGWQTAVPIVLDLWVGAVTGPTLSNLVLVQFQLVAISLLLSRALPVLDRWVPRSGTDEQSILRSLERVSLTLETLPPAYLAVLALQSAVAFVPAITGTFERVFGPVVAPVLATGVLQGALLAVALGLVTLIAVGKLQRLLATILGDDPSTTLAVAFGGALPVLASMAFDLALANGLVSFPASPWLTTVGLTPVLTVALAVVVLAVGGILHVVWTFPESAIVPGRGIGYAIGSAILAVTAIGGGLRSLPAVVVFVGVAGAILCWDLGTHAIGIGRQLGSQARTDRAEFVHVTATTAVLTGAVVLATAVHYLVIPTLSPGGGPRAASRAVLGLGGLAVATVAFFAATYLRERAA